MVSVTLTPYDTSGNELVTFTFQDGNVNKLKSEIISAPDVQPLPIANVMQNFAYDFEGVSKIITMSGRLTAATSTRVTGGFTITSILQQKRWLESLHDGFQQGIKITSAYESQSSYDKNTTSYAPYLTNINETNTNNITVGYIVKLDFDEEEANPNSLLFTMTLHIAAKFI